jgi:hypothetical protein
MGDRTDWGRSIFIMSVLGSSIPSRGDVAFAAANAIFFGLNRDLTVDEAENPQTPLPHFAEIPKWSGTINSIL